VGFSSRHAVNPGDTLHQRLAGRYDILRELGRGGAATVYLARDTRVGGLVAVKLLLADATASHIATRFVQEVSLMANFRHAHILPVLDSGEWQGRPWYVMLYVEGETLDARMRRERRLPITDVLEMARGLCLALSYAHARQVIHRDVKPSNVLLTGTHAYLSDFGIAKALEPVPGQLTTTTGIVVGTRAYMSPEQASADGELDGRTDIYSLGCVLFEALAGQHPFHSADENRMVAMRFTEPPDSLRRHRDAVPEQVEAAILRALERDPADRWQSAREFADALGVGTGTPSGGMPISRSVSGNRRRISNGEVPPATTAARGTPAPRGTSRRHWWGAVLGLVLVASAAAMVIRRSRAPASCGMARATGVSPQVVLAASGVASSQRAAAISAWRRAVERWADVRLSEAEVGEPMESCRLLNDGATHIILLSAVRFGARDRWTAEVIVPDGANGSRRTAAMESDTSASGTAIAAHQLLAESLRPIAVASEQLFAAPLSDRWGAWERYAAARAALDSGSIARAESLLVEAMRVDPEFGIARAWLGMARSWRLGTPPTGMPASRELEFTGKDADVPPLERLVLAGIAHLASREFDASCAAWRGASEMAPSSAIVQLGLGDCARFDDRVLLDTRNRPRFASSYAGAFRHYQRALDRCGGELCASAFARIDRVLPDMPQIRQGARPDDGPAFAALQSLRGDTLAHDVIPLAEIQRGAPGSIPGTLGQALAWARAQRVQLAGVWLARDGESAEGHAAMSRALELRGVLRSRQPEERSALSENSLALRYSHDAGQRLQAVLVRGRLMVRAGLFDSVAMLSDSLRRARSEAPVSVPASRELAGLLAAAGMSGGAADVLAEVWERDEMARTGGDEVPTAALGPASDFLVLAALGVCGDTLRALEERVRRVVEVAVPETKRRAVLGRVMLPSVRLAASCNGYRTLQPLPGGNDPLMALQRLAMGGRFGELRRRLAALGVERRSVAIAEVSLDQAVQESLLLQASGDAAAASSQLQAALDGLSTSSGFTLEEVAQAAAIGRGLVLLSALDAQPEGWARGAGPRLDAAVLWRSADRVVRVAAGFDR